MSQYSRPPLSPSPTRRQPSPTGSAELLAMLDPSYYEGAPASYSTPLSTRSSPTTTPRRPKPEVDATRIASLRLGLEPLRMADTGDEPRRSPRPHEPVIRYIPIEALSDPQHYPTTITTGTDTGTIDMVDSGIGTSPLLAPSRDSSPSKSSPSQPPTPSRPPTPSPTTPLVRGIATRSPKRTELPPPPPQATLPIRQSPSRSSLRPKRNPSQSSPQDTNPLEKARYLSPTRLDALLKEQIAKNIVKRRVLAAAGSQDHTATLGALAAFFSSSTSSNTNSMDSMTPHRGRTLSSSSVGHQSIFQVVKTLQGWQRAKEAVMAPLLSSTDSPVSEDTDCISNDDGYVPTPSVTVTPQSHAQGCREHALRELLHTQLEALLIGDVGMGDHSKMGAMDRRADGRLPDYLLHLPALPYLEATVEAYHGIHRLLQRRDVLRAHSTPWYDPEWDADNNHRFDKNSKLSHPIELGGSTSSVGGNSSSSSSDDDKSSGSSNGTHSHSVIGHIKYDWIEVAPPLSTTATMDTSAVSRTTSTASSTMGRVVAPPGVQAFQCFRRLPPRVDAGDGQDKDIEEEMDAYPCGEYLLCSGRFASSDVDQVASVSAPPPPLFHNVVVLGFPQHCPLHLLVAAMEHDFGVAVAAVYRGPPSYDDRNVLRGLVFITIATGVTWKRSRPTTTKKAPYNNNDERIDEDRRMAENGAGNLAGLLAHGLVDVRVPLWAVSKDATTSTISEETTTLATVPAQPSAWVPCAFLRSDGATSNLLGSSLVDAYKYEVLLSLHRQQDDVADLSPPVVNHHRVLSTIVKRAREAHVQLLSHPSLVVLEVLRHNTLEEACALYPASTEQDRVLARQLIPQTISSFLVNSISALSRGLVEGEITPLVGRRAGVVDDWRSLLDAKEASSHHLSPSSLMSGRKLYNVASLCATSLNEDAVVCTKGVGFLRSTLRAYMQWTQRQGNTTVTTNAADVVSVSPNSSSEEAVEVEAPSADAVPSPPVQEDGIPSPTPFVGADAPIEGDGPGGVDGSDPTVTKYVPKKVRWTYSPPRKEEAESEPTPLPSTDETVLQVEDNNVDAQEEPEPVAPTEPEVIPPPRLPSPVKPLPPTDIHSTLLRKAALEVAALLTSEGEEGTGVSSLRASAEAAAQTESTVDDIAYFLFEAAGCAEALTTAPIQTCLDNLSSIPSGPLKF